MGEADAPVHAQNGRGGRRRRRRWLGGGLAVLAAAGASAVPIVGSASGQSGTEYTQTNLLSDIPGVARVTDPDLVNPWGQAYDPQSDWVSDNNGNVSTFYFGGVNGSIPSKVPLVVKIPGGAPTGIVNNGTGSGFTVTTAQGSAPADFIFDSEAGVISAWSGAVSGNAASQEFSSPRAVYKGMAIATNGGSTFLYAADFSEGTVDVFNDQFQKVASPGGFKDPNIPAGFAPFNIQQLNGDLYVTYAKQAPNKQNDVHGTGFGFVDVYDTNGNLIKRLISRGNLNSPWGLVIAPPNWGAFGGDLIVGNFGDGQIRAYDPNTGADLGPLTNTDGNPIVINGLWGLTFGNGAFGTPNDLVFTAGIGDESHGLMGEITPAG